MTTKRDKWSCRSLSLVKSAEEIHDARVAWGFSPRAALASEALQRQPAKGLKFFGGGIR